MIDLGTHESRAQAINAAGQVVGVAGGRQPVVAAIAVDSSLLRPAASGWVTVLVGATGLTPCAPASRGAGWTEPVVMGQWGQLGGAFATLRV